METKNNELSVQFSYTAHDEGGTLRAYLVKDEKAMPLAGSVFWPKGEPRSLGGLAQVQVIITALRAVKFVTGVPYYIPSAGLWFNVISECIAEKRGGAVVVDLEQSHTVLG